MKLHWPPVLVVVIVWKRLVTTTHYTILGLAGLLAMTEKQETRPDPDFLFFPVAPVAQIHSLVLQLQQSQWWNPERLLAYQMEHIRILAQYAAATTPFYADRLDSIIDLKSGELTLDAFRQIPVLRREDVQVAGERLFSSKPPAEHGQLQDVRTSGSTGRPVHVKTTALAGRINSAVSLRYHFWHRRDLTAKNLTIKNMPANAKPKTGVNWALGYTSRDSMVYNVATPHKKLFDLLIREDPDYLCCFPSTLWELIHRSKELGIKPGRLREVRTVCEVLSDELRGLCREQWNLPVSDNYSSEEFGIMSVQCPDHPWGHVQADKVLVEVLDDEDRPCEVGTLGRVVVSSLHNFATPLIRYELGDYGELGPACPCGRGLPVLRRIVGRKRNLVVLPTGEKIFPLFDSEPVIFSMPVRQYQITQKSVDLMEMRLVANRPLETEEELRLSEYYGRNFGYPFQFKFVYVDEISRSAGGKFEDFVSEVE